MNIRIYIIVYIIIPAPVVFPFEGQATSHAAPPVAHRARRDVHPSFTRGGDQISFIQPRPDVLLSSLLKIVEL